MLSDIRNSPTLRDKLLNHTVIDLMICNYINESLEISRTFVQFVLRQIPKSLLIIIKK